MDEEKDIKIEEKSSEEPEKKETSDENGGSEKEKKSQEIQTKWVLIIMGVLVIGLVASVWLSGESSKFNYVGLDWEKEMMGDVVLYTTLIRGHSPTGIPINFKMSFRNNPKEIKVPIEGDLNIIATKPIYLSLDMNTTLNECGTLSLINFGRFMAEMRFDLITAMSTQEKAYEHDRVYADCTTHPDRTVFILTSGNKSVIKQSDENPNCYILEVKGCEDIEVLEKVQVAIISQFTNVPL